MLNLTAFTTCLLGALQNYTMVNVTYVLCPGSWNCVCPFNITGMPGTTSAPRCVQLAAVDLFCNRELLVQEEANLFFLQINNNNYLNLKKKIFQTLFFSLSKIKINQKTIAIS